MTKTICAIIAESKKQLQPLTKLEKQFVRLCESTVHFLDFTNDFLPQKLHLYGDEVETFAMAGAMLYSGILQNETSLNQWNKVFVDSFGGNLDLIRMLLGKTDFATKKNVDKYILYAIDQKQQEIYLDLIRYKNAIGALVSAVINEKTGKE